MRAAFHKMHGAGNDFVVLDARRNVLPEARRDVVLEARRDVVPALRPDTIAALAHRRTGIGFDQLVLIEDGGAGADVLARFFNRDGGESGACGNASRCVAWLVGERRPGTAVRIGTLAGILRARILDDDQVEVGMGHPGLDWRDIPLSRPADTLHLPLPGDPAGCSMGNPHATLFNSGLDAAAHGPALQADPLFPHGANIGFATILSSERMRLDVFERGSGLTLACGSGACAAVVGAARRGLTGRRVAVEMAGGVLSVAWDERDGVTLCGPAALSFSGTVALPDGAPAR